MAKPTLDNNPEGTKIFFSIVRGNNKQSLIIKNANLKVIKKFYHVTHGITSKEERPKNIAEKLTTLYDLGYINRTGKNKWTRYSINYEGIIINLIKVIKYDLDNINGVSAFKSLFLNSKKNINNIATDKEVQKLIKQCIDDYFPIKYKTMDDVLRDIVKFIAFKVIEKGTIISFNKSMSYENFFKYMCYKYYIDIEDNPLISMYKFSQTEHYKKLPSIKK